MTFYECWYNLKLNIGYEDKASNLYDICNRALIAKIKHIRNLVSFKSILLIYV